MALLANHAMNMHVIDNPTPEAAPLVGRSMKDAALILVALVLVGCATLYEQTYKVEFGVVELPKLPIAAIPEALPVEPSRTIALSRDFAWKGRSARSSVRTIAVTIVPSGPWRYTEQIIYYPPEPPKRFGDQRTGFSTPPASVVTEGMDLGRQRRRGPTTIPVAFDEGDPAGPWRVEVFVDGEKHLDETFELIRP
jgi:hypothetical protein